MALPQFKNPTLLKLALTHRSFINEHKDVPESNERVEFLGDSILSFVVSSWLYLKLPEKPEGTLTNLRSHLVNTKFLAEAAKALDLGNHLLLSRGEEDGGGRQNDSLLADTFEALIGAIYLDQGFDAAKDFIEKTILIQADELTDDIKDPKSNLQEKIQAKGLPSPTYKVISETGPDHNKIFTVSVDVDNHQMGIGTGKSKRSAETDAAKEALTQLEKEA